MAGQNELDIFASRLKDVLGFDLDAYKKPQMERRMRALLSHLPSHDVQAVVDRMEEDEEFAQWVRHNLSIHVSEFFRDPDRWDYLRRAVLPRLGSPVRAWCTACSTGQEPYSLAMLGEQTGIPVTVWATDVDRVALARAKQGRYTDKEVESVPADLLQRFFRPLHGEWEVGPEIQRSVHFGYHDLLTGPIPGPWDLIVCRNVIIYFVEDVKERVLYELASALRPGGVLFLGSTEAILRPKEFGLTYLAPGYYEHLA